MRHVLVFATILLVLAALWLHQDRREIADRAAGVRRFDPTLLGCASILLAGAVYTMVALWSDSVVLALLGMLGTPIALALGALLIRSVLQVTAPKWFPEPPPEPAQNPPATGVVATQPPTLASSAFGRPAPAFEKVGTWMSVRGNCRNTAWTPALGPRTPKLAWQWDVVQGSPEYLYYLAGAPAVDLEGRAYLATSHGLVALDAGGRRLWSLAEKDVALPALDLSGNAVSAYEDRVLVAAPDGKATWLDCPAPGAGRAAAVTVAEDGTIYVARRGSVELDSGRLLALAPGGGKRWSVRCLRGVEYPPAIASGGAAHLSSHDSVVWNSDDPSASYDRWQALSAAGAETGRVNADDEGYGSVWGATAAACLEDGTPLVGIGNDVRIGGAAFGWKGCWGTLAVDPQGTLLVGGKDLVAIDLRAGREKWRLEAGGAWTPVVDGEGTVYAGLRGSIAALSPEGKTLWSWVPPGEAARHAGWLLGLAIGPERTLYVATKRILYALRW